MLDQDHPDSALFDQLQFTTNIIQITTCVKFTALQKWELYGMMYFL